MTLNGYSSNDAVRQIRYADSFASNNAAAENPGVSANYLRAIAVALAAIAARMEEESNAA